MGAALEAPSAHPGPSTPEGPDRMSPVPPNLFVIGAPKAGTTSLCGWLAQHPDVYWSVPKEPFHLAADFPGQREHFGFTERRAYLDLYDRSEATAARYRGDGSTTYLYSQVAVAQALRLSPDARFVVSLRDPAELIPSYHRTQVVALNEDRELSEAWRGSLRGAGPDQATPLDPAQVDYPRIGAQGAALAAVFDVVGRQRVHVMLFDDVKNHPTRAWSDLCDFLDIDADADIAFDTRNASTKAARLPALRRAVQRPPAPIRPLVAAARQWSRTTSLPVVSHLKRGMWTSAAPPQVAPELIAELRAHFASDICLLSELTGKDLSRWHRAGTP